MGYKFGTNQIVIAGIAGLVLATGFMIEGRQVRVSSAFAANTTAPTPPCPEKIEGCQAEIYDNVCYMVCDRGGTSAPMPEPLPTATPPASPTPTPTPTTTPTGGPTGPLTYEQKVKKLNDRCPNGMVPTQSERNNMIQEAIDVCAAVITEYASCQFLLGSQTTGYISLHQGPNPSDPYDPVTVLRSLQQQGKVVDAGRSYGGQNFGFADQGTGAGAGNISLLDEFFGLSRPYFPCRGANYTCTEAEIDAQLARPASQTLCSVPKRNIEARAHTMCHELGHRTKLGRHDNSSAMSTADQYNDFISRNCRLRRFGI